MLITMDPRRPLQRCSIRLSGSDAVVAPLEARWAREQQYWFDCVCIPRSGSSSYLNKLSCGQERRRVAAYQFAANFGARISLQARRARKREHQRRVRYLLCLPGQSSAWIISVLVIETLTLIVLHAVTGRARAHMREYRVRSLFPFGLFVQLAASAAVYATFLSDSVRTVSVLQQQYHCHRSAQVMMTINSDSFCMDTRIKVLSRRSLVVPIPAAHD
jgi:hypothetical protein